MHKLLTHKWMLQSDAQRHVLSLSACLPVAVMALTHIRPSCLLANKTNRFSFAAVASGVFLSS
jgi:hypothetical protein